MLRKNIVISKIKNNSVKNLSFICLPLHLLIPEGKLLRSQALEFVINVDAHEDFSN